MESPTLQDLQAFWDWCSRFDWFYEMSDDGRVWRAGCEAEKKLREKADSHPMYKAIYDGWVASIFSGEPWRTESIPNPARPV